MSPQTKLVKHKRLSIQVVLKMTVVDHLNNLNQNQKENPPQLF